MKYSFKNIFEIFQHAKCNLKNLLKKRKSLKIKVTVIFVNKFKKKRKL